eukprot:scaffold51543_cov21-Prasinocladus_malaysianus.AAC.1
MQEVKWHSEDHWQIESHSAGMPRTSLVKFCWFWQHSKAANGNERHSHQATLRDGNYTQAKVKL